MPRLAVICLTIITLITIDGCAVRLSSQPAPETLTSGFWFWQDTAVDKTRQYSPVDVLFVQVGTLEHEGMPFQVAARASAGGRWSLWARLPDHLPKAREYWVVFRYAAQGVPAIEAAPLIVREAARMQEDAAVRGLKLKGIQLDIDSPTNSLPQYAAFLAEVRKGLPPGLGLSITALLDWFRGGTGVEEVISQTDEFVPQFYDLGKRNLFGGENAIAAKIDAAHWGPIFNRFGKPFRVGIASFGRAERAPAAARTPLFFNDLRPLDLATRRDFRLEVSRNSAGELVLNYGVTRKLTAAYNHLEPGDAIQFILPTPEAVRSATSDARRMGGHLAGIVYFRWPGANESLTMQPDEVLRAGGFLPAANVPQLKIATVDGHCAAVDCADLYLENADPFSPELTEYGVHSSIELEYFLPDKGMPVRMTGRDQLTVSIPPYCGRGHLYLGRAVTMKPSKFEVKEQSHR